MSGIVVVDWKDTAVKAANTAWQTGIAVVIASGTGWVDPDVWQTAGTAAIAAGLSVLKGLTLAVARKDSAE